MTLPGLDTTSGTLEWIYLPGDPKKYILDFGDFLPKLHVKKSKEFDIQKWRLMNNA